MITAKVTGADVLARRLRAMVPEIYRRLPEALDKGANEVVNLAQVLVPSDDGDLRASIRTEPGPHELSRKIVAGDERAFYAKFVEFGVPQRAATPFFFPAWRALRKRTKARIGRAARAAIKAAARK